MSDLGERILATPREEIMRMVEAELRRGTPWQTLQGALFLAGVREIDPVPVGGKLHAVLMVPAVFDLAEAGPDKEALLPVLHNLHEIKESQARDAREGNWRLGKVPEVDGGRERPNRGVLDVALRERDGEAAERALMGLLASSDARELYEAFWLPGARCFAGLAHKMILVSQLHRTLERVGWERAEPVLRALTRALSDRYRIGEYPDDHETRSAAGEMVAGGKGGPDPRASLQLFARLASASPSQGAEIVLAGRRDGTSDATLWDALYLSASDIFARGPGLLPVHPVTVMNAMAHAHRTTSIPGTRDFVLVQAATWIPTFREDLARRRNLAMGGVGLEELQTGGEGDSPTVEGVFREPTRQRIAACVAREDRRRPFEARLRRCLYRGASDAHHVKFCAAVLENARRAHGSLAPLILAPVLDYLPGEESPENTLYAESVKLIRRVG